MALAADFMKSDREIVLTAITSDWQALQFAAPHLKADNEIVIAAVIQVDLSTGFCFNYT